MRGKKKAFLENYENFCWGGVCGSNLQTLVVAIEVSGKWWECSKWYNLLEILDKLYGEGVIQSSLMRKSGYDLHQDW